MLKYESLIEDNENVNDQEVSTTFEEEYNYISEKIDYLGDLFEGVVNGISNKVEYFSKNIEDLIIYNDKKLKILLPFVVIIVLSHFLLFATKFNISYRYIFNKI